MNDGSQITLNGISIEPKTSKTYGNTRTRQCARCPRLRLGLRFCQSCPCPALKPVAESATGTVNGIYMFAVISHLPVCLYLTYPSLSLSLPLSLPRPRCLINQFAAATAVVGRLPSTPDPPHSLIWPNLSPNPSALFCSPPSPYPPPSPTAIRQMQLGFGDVFVWRILSKNRKRHLRLDLVALLGDQDKDTAVPLPFTTTPPPCHTTTTLQHCTIVRVKQPLAPSVPGEPHMKDKSLRQSTTMPRCPRCSLPPLLPLNFALLGNKMWHQRVVCRLGRRASIKVYQCEPKSDQSEAKWA